MGRNGSGKTTLLRTVMGLLRPSAARPLAGREPPVDPAAESARLAGYVPQKPAGCSSPTACATSWPSPAATT